ncbi:alpha-glucosidase [Lacticaseibacillus nasuensis]|uniref:alpha-glucosidase n=1 Tax=Lacticaseibacillus nasuensis TaxID=944671 RepID=UPI002247BEA9|nr:alpha-glucosidase [Lacticaseibacillus nasuensis]MCX2455069.1 alpha-glucosidase [Lacticaseibacillus nasuensis]
MSHWWQDTTVYQIYPRSFQDSNGDGIGDLRGIIQRLDYLQDLGVGALWLCPIYQSPNDDNGYDIANYREIMSEFGTMADFDELVSEAKKRGMRLIMDLVVNHTSDEHAWFIDAKSSPTAEHRDWYIWRDPAPDGGAPNALSSMFGGSAWEYDQLSGQYYLHLFSKKQPDLNWANPAVHSAVYDMMNFWLDKGIGGFRMDVIELLGKEPDRLITGNGPRLHEYLQEMNHATFGRGDYLTVGECWGATPEIAHLYTDADRHELSMIFQFGHIELDQKPGKDKWETRPLNVNALRDLLFKWQDEFASSGWPTLFWSNHDVPRIARWTIPGPLQDKQLKMFATLLYLMKGTPFIFQGEELGLRNHPVTSVEELRDIESINLYHSRRDAGQSEAEILSAINEKGRDNARRPMQWSSTHEAGFTTGKPWIALNNDYQIRNAELEAKDPNSVLAYYRQLLHLRKSTPSILKGQFIRLPKEPDGVAGYIRTFGDVKLLVVANMTGTTQHLHTSLDIRRVLLTNGDFDRQQDDVILPPYVAFAAEVVGGNSNE